MAYDFTWFTAPPMVAAPVAHFSSTTEPDVPNLDDQVRFLMVLQKARMVEPRCQEALRIGQHRFLGRRRHFLIIANLTFRSR
ncbi:MAG: hypothetical protein ABSC94_27405 [Polyangiaceae bacterium]